MRPPVVGASVWGAAADSTDAFHQISRDQISRDFLRRAAAQRRSIVLPAFTRLEIAGALARRLRDPARALAAARAAAPMVQEQSLDEDFLREALAPRAARLLRAADARYTVSARRSGGILVTWDGELRRRADGQAPTDRTEEG